MEKERKEQMKNGVTVEELNAAAVLLTGVTASQLVEVHISGGIVSAVVAGEERLEVLRLQVLSGEEPVEVSEPEEVEEVEEDDGS